jgi:hypothetical protein
MKNKKIEILLKLYMISIILQAIKFKTNNNLKRNFIQSNFITMSSFSNNNNKMNTSVVYRSKLFRGEEQKNSKPVFKTCCKVCQDAGKLEQEYTNHSVRDKNGKTVCPTLLSQECRNCFKHGHTVKYCPSLKARSEPVKSIVVPPVQKQASKPKNVFMVLESDSEEEEEEKKVEDPVQHVFNNMFPVMIASPLRVDQRPAFNYSKIISQVNDPETHAKAKEAEMRLKAAAAEKERLEKKKQAEVAFAISQAKAEADREAREARMSKIKKTCSWADAESSDEEEDEDDTYDSYASKSVQEVVDNSAW